MKTLQSILLLLLWSIGGISAAVQQDDASLQVVDLRSEYQVNPLGIDVLPQLGWKIDGGNQRGVYQTAYRILIASSLEKLNEGKADVWDSQKIMSSGSLIMPDEQLQLQSRKRYFWKVKVWTNNEASAWSENAYFETGLLHKEDWVSGWIGYVPGMPGRVLYFKGTFSPKSAIRSARAYISGIGYSELYINKVKIGDHLLDPAQSNYSKRVYYVTYDVTEAFNQPHNSIVIPVAGGWLGTPRLRAQFEITYDDNSVEVLTSDRFRSVTTGPILYSTVFDGEQWDLNIDTTDLYKPGVPVGLMNHQWAWAHNTDEPTGKMVAQKIEPIKIVEEIRPELIGEPKPGVYVFDAKRNLAGWVALKTEGEKGRKITLKFAETLYDNGMVNQENLRNAKAEDSFILNGKRQWWEPAFTYHGFRYVQVEGLPSAPMNGDILVKVVRSTVNQVGSFECSNELLNRIHTMVVNTEASNLHSVPTDCPQRDERMGWLNDLTVRIEQAIYNFDFSRFYPKFIDDISDTQDDKGRITCVAPFKFGARPADPVSASYLLLAQHCYQFYGDTRIIKDHFEGMKAWVDFLNSRTENGIVDYSYYGDWCPPKDFLMDPNGSGVSRDTPGKLISTGYLYYCANLLVGMAKVLHKEADAERYAQLAQQTREAFNREYWNEKVGGYASNNQACNSFALYMGLVDKRNVGRVVDNLVKDVKKYGYHLTTGNLCTKFLMETLTEYGHVEVAYKIATQTTYPSWGFMLANGATTLWERWEYLTGDAMNSHNHPMMGAVDTWFYKYILGISPDSHNPGFGQFQIKPFLPKDLNYAKGTLHTVKGEITVDWKKQNRSFVLGVKVPANSTAIVYIPAKNSQSITENGLRLADTTGIEMVGREKGYVIVRIGSGNYTFNSKL